MADEYDLVVEALPAYEVGDELGRGAWGVVLAGMHRQLRRAVAIKQLPREFGANPEVRARFLSEARTLASFDHPHIVHIHDFVEHKGVCLLIMDQLTGGTVGSRFRTDGFTPQAACALTLATCAGLQYAHERGVLHRDVKPENLMFSGDGVLKVVDFGIAKLVGGSSIMATRAGTTLGTPAYIAPEQARSAVLTPATDVYATATMLYELLAGELPYPEVSDPVAAIYQHIHEDPRPLLDVNPAVPPELAAVVDSALARNPSLRPQSAEEFGQAVARAATDAWGIGWSSATGVPLRGDVATLLPSGERRNVGQDTPRLSPATVVHQGTIATASTAGNQATPKPPADATLPDYVNAKRSKRRPIAIAAGAGAAVIAAVVATALLLGGHGAKSPTADSTTSTTDSTAASADSTAAPAQPTTLVAGTSPASVAKAMLAAYNAGDDQTASTYFAPPLDILNQHVTTTEEVKNLFANGFCGGMVQSVTANGEDVLVDLKLFARPGHEQDCAPEYRGNDSPETITVHNGKIVSWKFS